MSKLTFRPFTKEDSYGFDGVGKNPQIAYGKISRWIESNVSVKLTDVAVIIDETGIIVYGDNGYFFKDGNFDEMKNIAESIEVPIDYPQLLELGLTPYNFIETDKQKILAKK